MCLIFGDNRSLEKRKGLIRAYKVYDSGSQVLRYLYSPILTPVKIFPDGTIVSNRKSAKIGKKEIDGGLIQKGIHVFLTKQTAEICQKETPNRVMVQVLCDPKDFVAMDESDPPQVAVFTKIKVPKNFMKQYPYNVKKQKPAK